MTYKIFETVNNFRVIVEGCADTLALADFLDQNGGFVSCLEIHYKTNTGAICTCAGVQREKLEKLINKFQFIYSNS